MKTLPISLGLTMCRSLIDFVSPKPGSEKKPLDFIVLEDGDSVYVRCLNGGNYNFQPKTFDGLLMTSTVSPSECVVTADKIKRVEVRPNLDRDRVVMIELRKSTACGCGNCLDLIVRIPSIRTGTVIGVDNDAQMHDILHRKAASENQSHGTNPAGDRPSSAFSGMFGGGLGGVGVIDLSDLFAEGGEAGLADLLQDPNGLGLLLSRLRPRPAQRGESGSDSSRRKTAGAEKGVNGSRRREKAGAGSNGS